MASHEEMLRRARRRETDARRTMRNTKTAYERHLENSRCPICRGDEVDGRVRNGGRVCYLSTCSCLCHARLRGAGRGSHGFNPTDLNALLYGPNKKDPFASAPRPVIADRDARNEFAVKHH